MEADKRSERAKRILRSAGSGVGRGAAGLVNWSISTVLKAVMPLLIAATVVLSAIFGGGYYWQVLRPQWAKDGLQEKIKPFTPAEIDETNLACGYRMAWEDGSTDRERLFALIAGYNLSKEMNTGLCDISRKFWTLRAQDHPVISGAYRPTDMADYFKDWTPAQLAQYNQLKMDFKKYRDDPNPLLEAFPWLACVTKYQRTTYPWPIYPRPDKKLDATMRLVFTSDSGAKYFCPR